MKADPKTVAHPLIEALVNAHGFILETWGEKDGSLCAVVMPSSGCAFRAWECRGFLPERTPYGPLCKWMPLATGKRLSEVLEKIERVLAGQRRVFLERDFTVDGRD